MQRASVRSSTDSLTAALASSPATLPSPTPWSCCRSAGDSRGRSPGATATGRRAGPRRKIGKIPQGNILGFLEEFFTPYIEDRRKSRATTFSQPWRIHDSPTGRCQK